MPHDLYSDIFDTPASAVDTSKRGANPGARPVANQKPVITNTPYRLAIIGEAPGADEAAQGRPFVGASGRELDKYLSRASILREACFVGNVCQYQPPGNKIAAFDWEGPEIQTGLKTLADELAAFKPNLCFLLGGSALHAFKCGVNHVPSKRKTKEGPVFAFPNPIGDWRGSLFTAHPEAPLPGVKCVASYHPAAAMRQFEWMPLILLDLVFKVVREAKTPNLTLPARDLRVNPSWQEILTELEFVKRTKPTISVDIEGGVGTMSCISVATSPASCFIVPFAQMNGSSFYSTVEEECAVWRALASVLGDPGIPKILQNSLYDRFVLQYSYGIVMRGVVDDTMLKHWELYCELEKSLGFMCSLYTNEPYYKSDRHSDDRDTFFRYCCRDSATTYEISNEIGRYLGGTSKKHYEFNMTLLNPLLYMELRGLRYDAASAKRRLAEVEEKTWEFQYDLDKASGRGVVVPPDDKVAKAVLLNKMQDIMCYKRDRNKPKAEFAQDYDRLRRILLGPLPLSKRELGLFNTACKLSLNVRSPKFKTYLYEERKFPVQYTGKGNARHISSDFNALLNLQKTVQDPVIDAAIGITMHRTRVQMLSIQPGPDGRMHCSYNEVGSETGRVSSSRSPIRFQSKYVGTNMQTVSDDWEIEDEELVLLTEGLRDLYLADDGCYLYKADLKGADGWTIGANMAALGDPTMLDDLKAGVKPAQVVCYILRHGGASVAHLSRAELKEVIKEVKKEDWDYYVCKQVIWGTCYLMGPRKVAEQVFKESYGKVSLTEKQARDFQAAVFVRYRVRLWHDWRMKELRKQAYPPCLVAPSGHVRKFFGRYTDVLGEALAHEPQAVTTYVTNLAVYNCWTDPDNRVGNKLRLEPMHQVHDEFLMQGRIADHEWNLAKIKQWFNNKVIIAGIPLVIPFDGAYGTAWGMTEKTKMGPV